MIIVLKQDAPEAKVHEFCRELEGMGLQINDSKGSDTHILGLIGDTKAIAESWVLANPVVETCRRVSEPYKKANRKFHPDDSVIDVEGVKIGGGSFAVIASDDTSPKGRGFSISQHVSFSFEADNFILPLSLPKFKNF